ncbi:Vacuolar protein sorting-associated protein 13, partial [Gonioctena quinquepunctata]
LGPINSSARLKINQTPASDSPPYSIPKIHLNLQMEKLFIGITKSQYRDIIALADSMGRMSRGIPFRKYRPNLTAYAGHYKEWWHFAYDCVIENNVRRRRRNWDWNHILAYRNECKEYKHLYSKQVNNQLVKSEEKLRLVACEKTLDLTSIIIMRQQVEVETERSSKVQIKKGWFSWSWNSSTDLGDETQSDNILKKFRNEMTPDEKNKLYKAIDYQENAGPAIYPEEYMDTSMTFLLKTLEVELRDDDKNDTNNKSLLVINLKSVKCKLETRPATAAVKIHVKIDDFTALGMQQNDFKPKIITSETGHQEGLLEVLFETNPSDRSCDQRIHIVAQPLKIIYDSQTINKVVEVFRIPPESTIDSLQDAASHKLTDVKEITSLGLQYAIEKHILLDLNLDLQAPLVIIPSSGKFSEKENVLLVNLGRLKIYTHGKRSSSSEVKNLYEKGKDQKGIFDSIKIYSYDNFRVEFTDLQILIARGEEDWLTTLKNSKTSDMHLLSPLSLSINYSKCMIVDDPRLPLNTITGELPSVDIILSKARIILLMELITSIELPGNDIPEPKPLTKNKGTSSSRLLQTYRDFQDTAKHKKLLPKPNTLPADSDVIQLTTFEARFIMSEFSLTVDEQEVIGTETTKLASFKLNSLECGLMQQTYVTNVSLLLGSISLKLNRHEKVIDIIRTPSSGKEKECLFKATYIQVDKKCPDLHLTHKSCESRLFLNFEMLNITLHQEGLLCLMKFSTTILNQIKQIEQNKKGDKIVSTKFDRQLSSIGENIVEKRKTPKKKLPAVVGTIKFKLEAMLNEVEIQFVTDENNISSCAVRGIETTIIIKDTYTQINSMLQDIAIIDLNPKTHHKLILSGMEGVALKTQIVVNDSEDNPEKPNIDVIVKMGEMRIVFLNCFVSHMLNFLNQFQTAQQKIIEASQAAAHSARENMKDVYAKATKISLDIDLKAPVLLVPVDSRSYDCLLLDMGVIKLSNTFLTIDVKNEEGHPVTVDDLKICLTELKVSRIHMNTKCEIVSESSLLDPLTFIIVVKRNLSAWYRSIPDIDVFGKIGMIEVSISKADYQMVMDILNGNLMEGNQQKSLQEISAHTNLSSQPVSGFEMVTGVDVISEVWKSKANKPHVFLKFTFSLEHFIINLFTGGTKELNDTSSNHDSQNQLARFSLEGFSMKGRMSTDQSLVTSILLLNCLLEDMRKGREGKLNRLIERTTSEYHLLDKTDPSTEKSMIDITLQQKSNDLFVDVRVLVLLSFSPWIIS